MQIVVPYIILGNYHFAKQFSCISVDVSFANCGLQFSVLDRYCANRCSGQLFFATSCSRQVVRVLQVGRVIQVVQVVRVVGVVRTVGVVRVVGVVGVVKVIR